MANQLTIVTHTQGNRLEFLHRCIASVKKQLPSGCEHVVVVTNDLMRSRWEARLFGSHIAFVDDDDVVVNNSIGKCWHALQQGYDLAFTYEARADLAGNVQIARTGGIYKYSNIANSPKIAHHLSAFSTSKLTESWGLYQQFGGGLEWFMKAEAGLKGTACHIREIGYHWTSHVDCFSGKPEWKEPYNRHMKEMREALGKWIKTDQYIPTYNWAPF